MHESEFGVLEYVEKGRHAFRPFRTTNVFLRFDSKFSSEISCFLAVMRCRYEICRVLLHTFLMRFRTFWPL
jgi:hypothetical protein